MRPGHFVISSIRLAFAAAFVAAILTPRASLSQIYATVGVYDDEAMTRTSGTMSGEDKTLYLGIKFDPTWYGGGFTGFEFSVQGLSDLDYTLEFPIEPVVIIGDAIAAPPDSTGEGGLNAAWNSCLPGDRVIATLTLHAGGTPPANRVLSIARRFPPSNSGFPEPLFTACSCPAFCLFSLGGVEYTLNPTVAVREQTWTAIKRLYEEP